VNQDHIRQDLERLSNALPHRAANTENERTAAQYLFERFHEYTPDVEMDDFYSPEAPTYLFASYYGEFFIVAILSYWLPWLALLYGMGVLLAYITEFNGFALLSRFMPHYETQNVVARFMGTQPKRLLVVSANYDTGVSTPLTDPRIVPWLRPGHFIILVAMVLVIATCGLKALGVGDSVLYSGMSIARNVALVVLVAAAALLVYADFVGEHVRGSVNNAAGAAALVALAERLREAPIEDADVWLVATGAKESWMAGMRHFISAHKFDRDTTYFINIASGGAGNMRYVTGEGMLHLYRSPRAVANDVRSLAQRYNAAPLLYRNLPTDTFVPLSRGYKAIGVMATAENDVPPHWRSLNDNISQVDCAKIEHMALFADALARTLGAG